MKERIKEFIDYKGIQAGELASLLEVQRSNISHILNGRNKPGALLIEKMLLVFPELNARWLLTGEGNMLVSSEIEFNSKTEPVKTDNFHSHNLNTEPSKRTINTTKQIDKVILLYTDGSFTSHTK